MLRVIFAIVLLCGCSSPQFKTVDAVDGGYEEFAGSGGNLENDWILIGVDSALERQEDISNDPDDLEEEEEEQVDVEQEDVPVPDLDGGIEDFDSGDEEIDAGYEEDAFVDAVVDSDGFSGSGGASGEGEAGSGGESGTGGGSSGVGGESGTGGTGEDAGAGGTGEEDECVDMDDGDHCTTLDGVIGRCRAGSCCTGCWDGTTCRFQTEDPDLPPWSYELNSCGNNGVPCKDCDTGNPCKADECSLGIKCKSTNVPDFTECPGGQCFDGECVGMGGLDQPCEDGTNCDQGLVCDDYGICRSCGGEDDPCCDNDLCDNDLICDGDGTCQSSVCGGVDQECCSGNVCLGDFLSCEDGTCSLCGHIGQDCCSGTMCSEGICNSGVCDCGAKNQPCCPVVVGPGTCDEGLTCYIGTVPNFCF